jgi:hypothetical protein
MVAAAGAFAASATFAASDAHAIAVFTAVDSDY